MKRVIFIGIMVTLLGLGVCLAVNGSSNDSASAEPSNSLTDRVEKSGGQLVDVRTPEEFAVSHAAGSTNIPIEVVESGDLSGFDNSLPIYLYCRSGNRAGQVKVILEQAGFDNVINIGGLADWENQGGKVL